MSVIQVALTQRLAGVDCVTTYNYAADVIAGALPADVGIIADSFENVIIPALNALQSEQIENISLYATQLSFPQTTQNRLLSGFGTVTATVANTLPPRLAIYARQSVGSQFLADTIQPYNGNRPITRGGIYIPGLTEEWVTANGGEVPAALLTAWNFFVAATVSPTGDIPNAGREWYPAVFSTSKAALPPSPTYPLGKDARGALQARLIDMDVVNVTRLKSRSS